MARNVILWAIYLYAKSEIYMCAINGFNFRNEILIKRMIERTKHRGPDQEGHFCDDGISLGSARLSIIDLSERGRQPIWNEDKSICIVMNGEIYNFKEMREAMLSYGHKFYSDTDTEVVVHLYEQYGKKCVEFLNGIFAIAIWDNNKKEFFLARDRIGVKPLYYYIDPSTSSGQAKFIFSSEAKAILEHPIERKIEERALGLYFKLFYVPGPLTLFKNILKLPPAHRLVYKNGKVNIERYWDLKEEKEVASKEEAVEKIREIAGDSVRRQLMLSDRPVGIFFIRRGRFNICFGNGARVFGRRS